MNLNIFTVLLTTSLANFSGATTEGSCSRESIEKEQLCGTYCYTVVKPLLNYATLIRSKEEQFAELENKIRDQEAVIVNLKEIIKQKDIQITQQNELTALYRNNIAIQEKQGALNEAQITKLQLVLSSKDNQIFEKDTEIKRLKDKDTQLSLNDAKVEQLEQKFLKCKASAISSICQGKSTDVYTINVPDIEPFSVACDSKLAGSGWIVIQRRINGSVNFNRDWKTYKQGFGDVRGEFFMGLESLHFLTQSQPHELYVYLEDFENRTRHARYSHFLIGNETEAYEIKKLGDYSGDANDSMIRHLNVKFSTSDRDNDKSSESCASYFESGWWFNKCYFCNLNGRYTSKDVGLNGKQISWILLHTKPIKTVQMMIRPKSH